MKKVTIYSTPTCMYCKMAKEFMEQNNVPYEEFDVAADEVKRSEMMDLTGQMGVPVIVVSDEDGGGEPNVIVGFDKDHVADLLGVSA